MGRVRMGMGLMVIVMALAAFAGCGDSDDDSVSQEELAQERKEAAQDAKRDAKIEQLEEDLKDQEKEGSEPTTPEPATEPVPTVTQEDLSQARDCGAVLAGPNTSCAFARNVADEYNASGSSSLSVYSPTTGETYQMTCGGNAPVVCFGGNDATVYFP